jgi:Cdc6-like AAA superfamily ATPase
MAVKFSRDMNEEGDLIAPLEALLEETRPDEVQNKIHEQSNLKYGGIHLLIGKRGSGKTYFMDKEVVTLSQIDPNELVSPITQCYYVSDKTMDPTVKKWIELLNQEVIQYIHIPQTKCEKILNMIIKTKSILNRMIHNELSPDEMENSEWVYDALHIPYGFQEVPHTIIILDDCLNAVQKNSALYKLLFENRQSKLIYMLALQDVSGIPPSMKANIDTLILFGGFPRFKFNLLLYHLPPTVEDKEALWQRYSQLGNHEFMMIEFS